MKKTYKILSVLIVVLMVLGAFSTVFAEVDISFLEDIKANENLGSANTKLSEIGSKILTIVTNVAMILAVVVIAVIGVKYMLGSTEEKAEYKKTMIPYVVGAILVFGASAIGRMVVEMAANI